MNRGTLVTLLSASLLSAAVGLPALAEAAIIVVPRDYATIQDALDNAATVDGDIILVKPGVYIQDLSITKSVELRGYGCGTSIIEGVATLPAASAPLAAPNIDIRANGARVTGFKIRSPLVTAASYSSGMVVVGTNVTIDHNCFEAGTGAGSQAIQTWAFSNGGVLNDISGLRIVNNKFTHRALVGGDPDAYEGVYINPQDGPVDPSNPVVIESNTFSGAMFRAVTVDARSWTEVNGNTISTTWMPGLGSAFPTFPRGIQLTDNYATGAAVTTNVTVFHNLFPSKANTKQFFYGIVLRKNLADFTTVKNSVVERNILKPPPAGVGPAINAIYVEGTGGANTLLRNQASNANVGIYVDGDTTVEANVARDNTWTGISLVGTGSTLIGNTVQVTVPPSSLCPGGGPHQPIGHPGAGPGGVEILVAGNTIGPGNIVTNDGEMVQPPAFPWCWD
jgi:parallel beta-helix repeat protein